MKLVIIIMITCFVQVSAATYAQKLTYSKKGASMEEIFKEIKKQTGYNVLYSPEKVDDHKKIDVDFKETALPEVLDKVTANQSLEYSIDDKNISIRPSSRHAGEGRYPQNLVDRFNNIDVHGKILDSEGKGLPGASVKVKSTGKAVSTDAKGNFFLRGVEEGAVLVISFIGYLPKEVNASANLGNIVLEQSLSKLDEVQVIAYGTTTQRLSTGNVSSVKAADIAKQPINNPLLALAGRVPGLTIVQSSGLPGAGVSVEVQGRNSLASGNDPFYVIDGVPFPSQRLSNMGSILFPGSPFSYLNPGDIESIDVLKDADATAIYGSRAANGAILITTKKGSSGQTKVDLNFQTGFGQVARKLDLMNTQQYLEMRKEAIKNDGLIIPTSPTSGYYDLTQYDQNRYTDWQKELIGNTARYNDIQASVSGGNTNTQISFGATYHRETDVFPGEFSDNKVALHFSLANSSDNKRFQFRFMGNYMNDLNKLPAGDLTLSSLQLIPNAPRLYDEGGGLNWELYKGVPTWSNPLADIIRKYNSQTNNLVSNAEVSYELRPGLNLKSTFGFNRMEAEEIVISPQSSIRPNITSNNRSTSNSTSNIFSWIIEPQLNYQFSKTYGKFEFLLGATFQATKKKMLAIDGFGYGNDSQLENIQAASTVTVNNSLRSVYNYSGLFGRINYNLNDKYLLNLTIRRDGSSRFGPQNLFHNFYAAAGAWIFSSEKWFKEKIPVISYGKVKLSYGTSGSDQIGEYQFMSLYNLYSTDISYGGGTAIKPAGHSNPYLQWEETHKLNAGLDLGFFDDRVIFNLNYYRNKSSNQLLGKSLPILTGFNNVTQNFNATVQNKGYEFSMNTINTKTKNFTWTSNLNLTINKNKLIKYEGIENTNDNNIYVIGEPITITKAYKFVGINSQTGFYQFRKAGGGLTDSPLDPDDKYVLINTSPKFYGGFANTLTYKGFSLDFLMQFVSQTGKNPIQFGQPWPGFATNSGLGNQPVAIMNRWKQVNDVSLIQKVSTDYYSAALPYDFATNSDFSYTDASYIRLKNVSVSWTIPKMLLNKVHVQNARIYLQGQNILTFTKYKGLDPENQSSGSLPPLRVITLGIQLVF